MISNSCDLSRIQRYDGRTAFAIALVGTLVMTVLLSRFGGFISLHVLLFSAGYGLCRCIATFTKADTSQLTKLYCWAYVIRAMAIVVLHLFSADGLFMVDDRYYHSIATELAHAFTIRDLGSLAGYLGSEHVAYPLVLSWTYKITGDSVLSGKLLNAVFGAEMVPVTYWLCQELTENRPLSQWCAKLTVWFGYDIAWTMFLMRDTILLCLFSLTICCVLASFRKFSLYFITFSLGLALVLNFLRFYAVSILVVASSVAALIHFFQSVRSKKLSRVWIFAGLAVALSGLTLMWPRVIDAGANIVTEYLALLKLFEETGPYSVLQGALTVNFGIQVIHGLVMYFISPIAWVFGGFDPIGYVFFPGMYVIYVLLPYFLVGFWMTCRRCQMRDMLVVFAFVLHASLMIYLYQSGERQRIMTDSLFIVFVAIGWFSRMRYRRFTVATYACLVSAAFAHIFRRAILG